MIDNLENIAEQSIDLSKEPMSEWADAIEPLVDSAREHIKNWEDAAEPMIDAATEKMPDLDVDAIAEDAVTGALAGGLIGTAFVGPIGTVPGILGGVATGVAGEIANQIAVQSGASETGGYIVETGVNVVTGVGIVKVVGKEGVELLAKHGDEIIKNGGEKVVQTFDDGVRYAGDKIKTAHYDAKGIVNNLKTHEFIDGDGKQFYAKITDVVDFTRTIKMPYIGSQLDNANSAGFERNSIGFAKQYLEKFPETMSKNNMERINNNLSPLADEQWIKFNPNHKTFLGQTLHHHHISNTDVVAYVPEKLHNGQQNKQVMHVDNKELMQELSSLIEEKFKRS